MSDVEIAIIALAVFVLVVKITLVCAIIYGIVKFVNSYSRRDRHEQA